MAKEGESSKVKELLLKTGGWAAVIAVGFLGLGLIL